MNTEPLDSEDVSHSYKPSDFCTINILDRSYHPFVSQFTVNMSVRSPKSNAGNAIEDAITSSRVSRHEENTANVLSQVTMATLNTVAGSMVIDEDIPDLDANTTAPKDNDIDDMAGAVFETQSESSIDVEETTTDSVRPTNILGEPIYHL